MEEQTAAPAPADTAAPAETAEAPAAPVDEVAAAMPENAGDRSPTPNKYKQEVENLLDAYEKKQARLDTASTLSAISCFWLVFFAIFGPFFCFNLINFIFFKKMMVKNIIFHPSFS